MTYPRSPSKFTQEPELRPRSHADFCLLTSSTVVPTRKWGVSSQPVHHGYGALAVCCVHGEPTVSG